MFQAIWGGPLGVQRSHSALDLAGGHWPSCRSRCSVGPTSASVGSAGFRRVGNGERRRRERAGHWGAGHWHWHWHGMACTWAGAGSSPSPRLDEDGGEKQVGNFAFALSPEGPKELGHWQSLLRLGHPPGSHPPKRSEEPPPPLEQHQTTT